MLDGHLDLAGRFVRLVPLEERHAAQLWEAGRDPGLWQWTNAYVRSLDDMRGYIAEALQDKRSGTAYPFVTTSQPSGRVIGSTRYGNIASAHRRLEIGWTWITPLHQRTAANTEAKYLMLRHAFEVAACLRVEFKTDALNARSRRALERIGAIEEGILRRHMFTATGRVRDTVYFSILADAWPSVKQGLEEMLGIADGQVRTQHPADG